MSLKKLVTTVGVSVVCLNLALFSSVVYATQAELCGGFSVLGTPGCQGYIASTFFYGAHGINGQNILYDGNPADWAIYPITDTAPELEDLIAVYLGSGTGYSYNKVGAAFIIDTMLGVQGGTLGNTANAIGYAQSHFNDWKTRVDYYAQQGWISWNVPTVLPPGTVNSLHACPTSIPSSSVCTLNNMFAGSYDARDLAWYRMPVSGGSEVAHELIFSNPDGSSFRIRRECANIIGGPAPLGPIQPPPSITATCSGVTIDPGRPDPHTPFTVTAAVDYNNAADASTAKGADQMFVTVSGPSLNYNNANVTPVTQTGKTLKGTANVPASNKTGTYAITYGMSGPIGAVNCNATLVIADQPYVSVTGGDAESGMGMSTGGVDCAAPADTKGGIVSWNRGASSNYAGAGTQYAALALNHLQDFATAQGSGLAPSGLAFANTADGGIDVANGLFGGLFAAEACAPDYFANATNVQTGNITIGGQAVPNGSHTTVYVKGNVYITGNITYSGSYGSVGDIPSYAIIVQGNIYIAPGVSRLDGLYVAEPTVSGGVVNGGTIYTCASGPFTAAALDGNLYNTCKVASLTVNGSFVARQVWLLRTGGTVSQGTAESFNFNPELWLTIPPASGSGGVSTSSTYDAITSLPPVL